jgi:enamine deaminase RidA (YjgF/YER057c/UK114 family)
LIKANKMTRTLISSGSPFETQVGYSRAVVDGDWCWVAGTTGPDPETTAFPEDVKDQTRNAFYIIEAALAEGGFTLADVVRVTYYMTDISYHDIVAPILGEKFGAIRPAATALVCGLIRPEMKIEIEVTAKKRR